MYVLQFNPTMDMEHAPISSLHSWYKPEHTVIKQLFKKKFENVTLQDPGLHPLRDELPEGRPGSSIGGVRSLERRAEVGYTAQGLSARQHGQNFKASERWECLLRRPQRQMSQTLQKAQRSVVWSSSPPTPPQQHACIPSEATGVRRGRGAGFQLGLWLSR